MTKQLQIYPEDALRKLDYPFLLAQLQRNCQGEPAKVYLQAQGISADAEWIGLSLQQVKEFMALLQVESAFPDKGFEGLPFIGRAETEGAALTVFEFVIIARFLSAFNSILQFFRQKKRQESYPQLFELVKEVYWEESVLKEVHRVIDEEKETVKADASARLLELRKQMIDLEKQQQSVFNKALRFWRQKEVLADQEEGLRNGRRMLAVKAEYKRQVVGIWHDDSANGSIAFIEPEETVHLNNELASLQREEQREIEKILRELTTFIRPHLELFGEYESILTLYDAQRAKARLAIDWEAVVPEISTDGRYRLLSFRHPVLLVNYRKQRKKVVENSVTLGGGNRVMLISGPNAGGKSVVLKSVGALQILFQMGMPLPAAEGSVLPVFEQLFADIGDAQSVENDLSTYSSHLRNMKHFTEHAHAQTLVLLDELGHGTDPALGGAMAEAALEYLNKREVYAVITTHYANLKAWGARTPGVINAAMSFDKKHLQPLYHLHTGAPGSSFTFEIAAKSGLNPEIIALAREKSGKENREMEQSLAEIQHEKQYVKGLRKNLQLREKQLDELQKSYEQLKKDLGKEKKRLLQQFTENTLAHFNESNRVLEQLMREWKEDKQDKEKFLAARKYVDAQRAQLEQQLSGEQAVAEEQPAGQEPLSVGSRVRLEDGHEVGEIRELRKQSAVVAFGNALTHIKLHRLVPVGQPAPKAHSVKVDTAQRMSERFAFDINLDVRGLLKEEALTALENFLDRALMFGCHRVRIVHGRGTGVLRQTVQHFLKRYPAAVHYGFEPSEQGGDGVTFVELR